MTPGGLGSVALDRGWSSVLEEESGVYNWVYIDIYPLDEFDGLCFFTFRYYCAEALHFDQIDVTSSEETSLLVIRLANGS